MPFPTICSPGAMPSSPTTNLYTSTELTTSAAYTLITDGARLVYLGGTYYTLGGWNTSPTDWGDGIPTRVTNQVWSSDDLITFTLELAHDAAPPDRWTPRHTFMRWMVGSTLYIGGNDQYSLPGNAISSDIWSTTDALTWTQVASETPWGAQGRSVGESGIGGVWNPICGVLGDYLYVMGGHRGTDIEVDVLNWPASAEMWRAHKDTPQAWTRLDDLPFSVGTVLDAVTLDDRMFVIGGNTGTGGSRVLSSATWMYDGGSWTQMSANSGGRWSARDYISTAAFDGKLWALTGYDGANAGGVHWSKDFGRTWERCRSTLQPSHADGTCVSPDGIAQATGNGQGTRTNLISIV